MNAESPAGGWTGGQYSLVRVLFGAYLAVHFAQLAPWGAELFSNAGVLPLASQSPLATVFPNVFLLFDSPGFVVGALVAGVVLSLLLAAGLFDRAAAVLLWYLWACLFGRNPLIANPGLPYVGWLLLMHAAVPRAPFGSLAALGRTDPRGDWSFPRALRIAAWVVMAAGYSYSGFTKLLSPSWLDGTAVARVLDNPLARPGPLRDFAASFPAPLLMAATWGALAFELAFGPLALWKRARPWLWTAMLAMHVSLIALIDFADLSLGMIMLHLFTFQPEWVKGRGQGALETVFYDGSCGLCHRAIRFALSEDSDGSSFRFAPLGGETFVASIPLPQRTGLPDSIVVLTSSGALLTRSSAVLHMLARLGGLWRVVSIVATPIPRPLRDAAYSGIAGVRKRFFRKPDTSCPLMSAEMRSRFAL